MAFDPAGGASLGFQDTILSHPLLGGGLPAEAQRHLERAGRTYHLTDVAETHLRAADDIAPDHAAVLIAHYRFYFYKGRLVEAVQVARACVTKAMRLSLLGEDWRAVQPGDAAFGEWGALEARFFLFSLKGYAYLNLRLGQYDEGRAAVEKLLYLDPLDRIGAAVLLEVLDRMDAVDE